MTQNSTTSLQATVERPSCWFTGFPRAGGLFTKSSPSSPDTTVSTPSTLRGFGDSQVAGPGDDSAVLAEDLHALIQHLALGPVHLTGQDISGATVFRLAVTHPEDVRSLTAIEMGLAGFGLEGLADVTHGGAWHIGVLAAAGIPEMLLTGREREFLGQFAFPAMCVTPGAISERDVEEFVRTYSRPGAWRGAAGLYQSMLKEGAEIKVLADTPGLKAPAFAVGAGGGPFTVDTMTNATRGKVRSTLLDGVGHYAAMEAPEQLAEAFLEFVRSVETA